MIAVRNPIWHELPPAPETGQAVAVARFDLLVREFVPSVRPVGPSLSDVLPTMTEHQPLSFSEEPASARILSMTDLR